MKKLLIASLLLAAPALAEDPLTKPIVCDDCAKWNEAEKPVHIHGNTAYVGVAGLASVLVDTGQGLILFDGDMPQSVPLIEANVRKLGHKIEDIKYILVSHEHFDHVGGVAALKRDSGAKVMAGEGAAKALAQGHALDSDPQAGGTGYPVVIGVETVEEGQQITLGNVTVTAHRTPGHTPGGTSWSWKSCEKGKCLDMVYADSLTPFSTAPLYRFTPVAQRFRDSIAKIRALPCDIVITTHPGASGFWKKEEKGGFIDPDGCRKLADNADAALDKRLKEEAR